MSTRSIAVFAAAFIATGASAALAAQVGTSPVAGRSGVIAMSAHRAVAQRLEPARGRCSDDSPAWNGANCRNIGDTPLPTASDLTGTGERNLQTTSSTAVAALASASAAVTKPAVAGPTVSAPGGPGAPSAATADGWTTRSVLDEDAPVLVPTINAAVITLDGKQRASDPRYYDLTINAGGTGSTMVSVYSAGAMTSPLHADLLHVDANTAKVGLHIAYHYNATQPVCLVQVLSTCAAHLPVDPANPTWISNHMNEATLTVTVTATVNGNLVSQKLDIPVAGQAGAILP